ncbi:hypothetical protein Moror_15633 [Moniliophthora roreri MCA 2997]|uniref:DUF6535 domain-containing protein n=2 Tax=Moniliophthora roreri TaxID=221103 RepID=V2WP70_MONRO|nr:hypothetical protein Moror_15633 [Moniliophthora roreri MCA 2997]
MSVHESGAVGKTEGTKKGATMDHSWEKLTAEFAKHDDGVVKNWKEDIDTLLVFAGLFSAVVTAFAIESYQWLLESPADTTVALLMQISMQLNASQVILPERASFKADASSIRINSYWFLSLVFSLTSALFGLLCKQWLREHQRDPPTRTPGEALALRQLRQESFEKWGVPSLLSALPILLEVALLLFFAGVLDLLWNRHLIPFALCFIAVMVSAGLYFVTTFLPTLTVPRKQWENISNADFHKLVYHFICPYKSPQAWAAYRLSRRVLHPLLRFQFMHRFLVNRAENLYHHIRYPVSEWSSLDLQVVRQFDDHPFPFSDSDPCNLKVYELRALQWAFATFRDSPSIVPHLENILGTLPPSVVMSAVFGQWKYIMWEDTTKADIELRLRDPGAFFRSREERLQRYFGIWWAPPPDIRNPTLHYPEGIGLLFCHQYWMAMARRDDLRDRLDDLFVSMRKAYPELQQTTGLRFVIPFPVVDILWTHEDPEVRMQSLRLLRLFEEAAWKPELGYDEQRHDQERLAFISALTRHLGRTDRASQLLTSGRGQKFIQFVNDQIIDRRLYQTSWRNQAFLRDRRRLVLEWTGVVRRVQEAGNLPLEYFAPIPDRSEDPPATFQAGDPAGTRYSLDTVHSPRHSTSHSVTMEHAVEAIPGQSRVRAEGSDLGLVEAGEQDTCV